MIDLQRRSSGLELVLRLNVVIDIEGRAIVERSAESRIAESNRVAGNGVLGIAAGLTLLIIQCQSDLGSIRRVEQEFRPARNIIVKLTNRPARAEVAAPGLALIVITQRNVRREPA